MSGVNKYLPYLTGLSVLLGEESDTKLNSTTNFNVEGLFESLFPSEKKSFLADLRCKTRNNCYNIEQGIYYPCLLQNNISIKTNSIISYIIMSFSEYFLSKNSNLTPIDVSRMRSFSIFNEKILILGYLLLKKYCQRLTYKFINFESIFKLFLACCILENKISNDTHRHNEFYSKHFQIDLGSLNYSEAEVMNIVNYDFYIEQREYNGFLKKMWYHS